MNYFDKENIGYYLRPELTKSEKIGKNFSILIYVVGAILAYSNFSYGSLCNTIWMCEFSKVFATADGWVNISNIYKEKMYGIYGLSIGMSFLIIIVSFISRNSKNMTLWANKVDIPWILLLMVIYLFVLHSALFFSPVSFRDDVVSRFFYKLYNDKYYFIMFMMGTISITSYYFGEIVSLLFIKIYSLFRNGQ